MRWDKTLKTGQYVIVDIYCCDLAPRYLDTGHWPPIVSWVSAFPMSVPASTPARDQVHSRDKTRVKNVHDVYFLLWTVQAD